MPFGLSGVPTAWQRQINDILRDHLDQFFTAYLDYVFTCSERNQKNYHDKVNKILERLENAELKFNIRKCDFALKQVNYLEFVIKAGEEISVDSNKKPAIEKYELP